MPRYRLNASVTVSIHAVIEAKSRKHALELAEELSMCCIHESTHDPDPADGDWHTSGELDGPAKNVTAALEDPPTRKRRRRAL